MTRPPDAPGDSGDPLRVLLIDDDPHVLRALRRTFSGRGCRLFTAGSAEEAEALLRRERLDVVVSDCLLPEPSGPELLRLAARLQPHTVRAMLTARIPDEAEELSREGIIHRAYQKPWEPDFPDQMRAIHRRLREG